MIISIIKKKRKNVKRIHVIFLQKERIFVESSRITLSTLFPKQTETKKERIFSALCLHQYSINVKIS